MCLSVGLFAQEGFKIGLRFSPIFSFGTVLDSTKKDVAGFDKSPKIGLSYGLLINYGFTENYGIHTGIHVVNKGYRGTDATLDSTVNLRVTTLEVPIALKLRSPEIGSGIHIKGLFGVSADINLAMKKLTTINSVETESRESNELIPVSASFIFGTGVEWEFDFGMIDFGVSYHQGLTNVNRKKNSGYNGFIRLNYVAIDLGYYF